jgi:hypothetical protein
MISALLAKLGYSQYIWNLEIIGGPQHIACCIITKNSTLSIVVFCGDLKLATGCPSLFLVV